MSTMHPIHIGVKKQTSFYYHLDEGGIDQEKNPIKTIRLSKDLKVYAPNKKMFFTHIKGKYCINSYIKE